LREEFTEGKTDKDWVKAMFEVTDLPKYISWEEFEKKGYYVINLPENYKATPSLRWFYEGRECDTPDPGNPNKNTEKAKELGTLSGKIEFVSQSLKKYSPDDEERPPLPHYIPSWEGHESKLAKKYPLQLITPHPRYSFHTHHDKHSPWLDEIPGHRIIKDGYAYLGARIHPSDAELRGIENEDVVKLYNDRGSVLCVAQVTERVRPGTIHAWASSAKYDPLEPGKPGSIDKGGCVNILSPSRMLSKNAPGMVPNSCLIEISKWEA
jgi:trimethylamine-N-oxide reductase (cytochrome c)